MITIEKIKNEFAYVKAWTGESEVYQDTEIFEGFGNFCDLYFNCKDKEVRQQQVDIFNEFKKSYQNYLPEINFFIHANLTDFEKKISEKIDKSTLFFDVIDIPFENLKYDLVLVCGKTYKRFIFLRKK